MENKNLAGLVLAGVLSLSNVGCDKRKDVVLKEGAIGDYKVKIVQEVRTVVDDKFYLEMSDNNGVVRLRTPFLCSSGYFIKLNNEEALKYDILCENNKSF